MIVATALALVAMTTITARYVRLLVVGVVDYLGSVGILSIVGVSVCFFHPKYLYRHCPTEGHDLCDVRQEH